MKHHCQIKVGPASFRIGSDWRQPIAQLSQLYADYPQGEGCADFTVRLEATSYWRRFIRPSVMIAGDFMLPDAAPVALDHGLLAAEMGMNLQMALGWRRHLLLHASAVSKNGKAVIMTGHSGSGKSTLAAMLGERGWRFMGDEFVLVSLNTGFVAPFPRLVSLKNQAISAMQEVLPGQSGRFGPYLKDTPKGDIQHFKPNLQSITTMNEESVPTLLLYPRFGYEKAIRKIGRDENFVRLTQASTNYVALGEPGFCALTRLVNSLPTWAIDFNNGNEAIDLVEQLWTDTVP